ncbi:MAG: hypothetical protein AAGL17_25700, partial [Cyanobacteria bacterium J06576_12]
VRINLKRFFQVMGIFLLLIGAGLVVHPRPEFDLTPLPYCVQETGGDPAYPKQTAGKYLEQRLKEIGLS